MNDNTDIEMTESSLTVRRTFDAPRERVWRAFTDSDELPQWFVPEGMEAEVHALEPEPDGAFAVSWTDGENRIDNEGTYVEVVENERLVAVEETMGGELRLGYEFRDVDDGTEVVITQNFPGSVSDSVSEGWAGMLDTLAEVL
ncbi:SRPBCC family protein [Haladaptatus halobius]|uniref:SRPBCC family protein n=1 Tax=Haladaptatus halobius TaxID=2884875 RepID=UPI001D0A20C0|nr:SRPBCC domain-containing protein [Haladaptatus halobius]